MLRSVIYGFIGIMVLSPKPSLAVKTLEVRLGAAVMLQCDLSYHFEINWMRMSLEMKPELLMVLGLNNNGDLSITWTSNSSGFQGLIKNRFIQLRIGRVSEADLATYFCMAINVKRIVFGEAMQLNAILDAQQPQDQNLTHCKGHVCQICSDPKPEGSGGSFYTHMIISGVLSCSVLLMVFTIIAVHLMTSERRLC